MKTDIPENILSAVNALLAPYGEKFVPGGGKPASTGGCLCTRDAAAYLGVSRSTLWRLAKRGSVHPIKLNKAAPNGLLVFARADLDEYLASCRD